MDQIEFFETLLKVDRPWYILDIDLDPKRDVLTITIATSETTFSCPICGIVCAKYAFSPRRWRLLNTMEYKTFINADLPCVNCKEYGVLQVHVPWAEALSRYTI